MANERDLPQHDGPDEDFGGFLGRRLRSYQSGVLGLKSLIDVPVSGAAAEHGANVVSRNAEFAGSLQSLLSYRTAPNTPAPAPLARESDSHAAAPATEHTADTAPGAAPAPSGPISFGSDAWFARMAQRIAATEQRQRESAPVVSGPSAAAIEAALGIDRQAQPARPSGNVRRRSVVQEMSGAGVEFAQDWSVPRTVEAAPAAPPDGMTESPAAAAQGDSVAEALARAESVSEPAMSSDAGPGNDATPRTDTIAQTSPEPRLGPALVQRRPRRRATEPPLPSTPVQRLGDSAPGPRSISAATPALPTDVLAMDAEPAQPASETPPAERRTVMAAPANRNDPPEEGREGVRRVTPVAPRPPAGAPSVFPEGPSNSLPAPAPLSGPASPFDEAQEAPPGNLAPAAPPVAASAGVASGETVQRLPAVAAESAPPAGDESTSTGTSLIAPPALPAAITSTALPPKTIGAPQPETEATTTAGTNAVPTAPEPQHTVIEPAGPASPQDVPAPSIRRTASVESVPPRSVSAPEPQGPVPAEAIQSIVPNAPGFQPALQPPVENAQPVAFSESAAEPFPEPIADPARLPADAGPPALSDAPLTVDASGVRRFVSVESIDPGDAVPAGTDGVGDPPVSADTFVDMPLAPLPKLPAIDATPVEQSRANELSAAPAHSASAGQATQDPAAPAAAPVGHSAAVQRAPDGTGEPADGPGTAPVQERHTLEAAQPIEDGEPPTMIHAPAATAGTSPSLQRTALESPATAGPATSFTREGSVTPAIAASTPPVQRVPAEPPAAPLTPPPASSFTIAAAAQTQFASSSPSDPPSSEADTPRLRSAEPSPQTTAQRAAAESEGNAPPATGEDPSDTADAGATVAPGLYQSSAPAAVPSGSNALDAPASQQPVQRVVAEPPAAPSGDSHQEATAESDSHATPVLSGPVETRAATSEAPATAAWPNTPTAASPAAVAPTQHVHSPVIHAAAPQANIQRLAAPEPPDAAVARFAPTAAPSATATFQVDPARPSAGPPPLAAPAEELPLAPRDLTASVASDSSHAESARPTASDGAPSLPFSPPVHRLVEAASPNNLATDSGPALQQTGTAETWHPPVAPRSASEHAQLEAATPGQAILRSTAPDHAPSADPGTTPSPRERVLVTAPASATEATDLLLRSPSPALVSPADTVIPRTAIPNAFGIPGHSTTEFAGLSSSPAPTAGQAVRRSAEPVAMPLAPAQVQREPAPLSGPATGQIQRVENGGSQDSRPNDDQNGGQLDYDRLADEVWPRIRRKLRVERERERGLPY